MNDMQTLKQYALDNYEAGGHWVFETYSDDEYAQVLAKCPTLEEAKAAIKETWEFCVEQQQECGW